MKALFSLVTAVIFSLSATAANPATQAGIQQLLNALHYSLSVEWDQVDQAFHEAALETFRRGLADLKAQGATNEELIQATLAQVKGEQLRAQLSQAFALISAEKLTAAEAQELILDVARGTRDAGASWVGGAGAGVLLGSILTVAILVAVFSGGSSSGEACTSNCPVPVYSCGYQHVCSWGHDSWGSYRYSCGYDYVCGYYYW